MTPIAPHISTFLRERLPHQRGASPHTCDSYAYSFQLLFEFASQRLDLRPSALTLEQIDAQLVMDFLASLETKRGNSPTTRNETIARIPGSFYPARVSCKAFRVWSRPSPWASRHISSAMRALICSWVRTL